jgi:hypothetical protein
MFLMLLAPHDRRKAPDPSVRLDASQGCRTYTRAMDPAVLKAMVKWPSVPSVYGWLVLDRRGTWSIKGEPIGNPTVAAFIGRNYERDDAGRYFFQNGPQRVFVGLAYAPFVLRVQPQAHGAMLFTHVGGAVQDCSEAFVDEDVNLLIAFGGSVGLVCDRDLADIVQRLHKADGTVPDDEELEALFTGTDMPGGGVLDLGWTRLPLKTIRSGDVAGRFGFDRNPRPAPGEPEC